MRWRAVLLVLCLLLAASQASGRRRGHPWNYCYSCPRDSHGHIKRSATVRLRFLHQHGLTRTPPGCQVDHIVPLAKGGSDTVGNLQLLCGPALKSKEARELR